MSDVQRHLIAGDWVLGDSQTENRNPSDVNDLIGLYAQETPDQLTRTIAQARVAQAE